VFGGAAMRAVAGAEGPVTGTVTGRAAGDGKAYHPGMVVKFTAVLRKVPEGYVAFVEELPGAKTQAATFDEARASLKKAVVRVLEANRALAQELAGADGIPEPPPTDH
jgi:predicted RNase H-like HicB family nuclease